MPTNHRSKPTHRACRPRILYCLSVIATLTLAGCAATPNHTDQKPQSAPISSGQAKHSHSIPTVMVKKHGKSTKKTVISLLKQQEISWRGVPYRFGGTTRRGIDCSAFVQNTFHTRLNQSLPRTTALQSRKGRQISLAQLKAGDLIFFKTGRNSRHVGIYMNNGNFMHSSSSHGVGVSKVNNVYWKRHFWQARRVI